MGDPFFLLDKNADDLELVLGNSMNKIRAKDIITNVKLESVTASAISYNKLCNIQSQAIRNRIKEILELIKRELCEKEKK
jgi:hypothetical protein